MFEMQGGILAAAVLLLFNRAVALLRLRGERWGRLIEGTPTVLIEDGELIAPHMLKEGMERDELEMVVREHGIDSLGQVKLAVLETDGSVSIVPMAPPVLRTRKHVRQVRRH